jgi:ribokinase
MILVFGSINVDLVMPVSSLPKPGETVLAEEYQQMPGGKGANQAYAARRAGAETVFVGSVGADSHAELALSLLKEKGGLIFHWLKCRIAQPVVQSFW